MHPISFDEPFGLSVAEAMLCGTPVIAFNKGSMPELIRHEETGYLVKTIDEAVDAISLVPNISREACRIWAVSNFSQQKMTSDYIRCYQTILG